MRKTNMSNLNENIAPVSTMSVQLGRAFFLGIRITINLPCKPIKLFYYLAAETGSFLLFGIFSTIKQLQVL